MGDHDGTDDVTQSVDIVHTGSDSGSSGLGTVIADEPAQVRSDMPALIVATGIAVSIPLFVVLSFQHSSDAAVLIPLVLTTAVPYLAKRYMDRKAGKPNS